MLASVRHNNVVTVYRAQQIGDEIGLTMELIRGRHLGDLVKQGGPMGAEEAAVIGVSLCQALAAAHGQGLLHRDVKSRNVMRESGGRIVLMDFGAGREVQQITESKRADLSGTPLYLAPELFAGKPASPSSDLYSLGVLLFYLVTKKYPVEGTTLSDLVLMHSSRERKLLSDVRPDLPAAFVQAVEHALAARPEQRYRTAGEMMAELRATLPISEAITPSPVPAPMPPRSSPWLRALVFVPLVVSRDRVIRDADVGPVQPLARTRCRIFRRHGARLVGRGRAVAHPGVGLRRRPAAGRERDRRDLALCAADGAAGPSRDGPGTDERLRRLAPLGRIGSIVGRAVGDRAPDPHGRRSDLGLLLPVPGVLPQSERRRPRGSGPPLLWQPSGARVPGRSLAGAGGDDRRVVPAARASDAARARFRRGRSPRAWR